MILWNDFMKKKKTNDVFVNTLLTFVLALLFKLFNLSVERNTPIARICSGFVISP